MTLTWIEGVSAALGLMYVWLASREQVWAWPFAILGSFLALFVFWEARLYLDFGLYVFFVAAGAYGWYEWVHGRRGSEPMPVARMQARQVAVLLTAGAAGSAALGYVFFTFTDASLPWLDATATVFSLIGTWMQARKFLENWVLWMAVNSVYIGIYFLKGLWFFQAQAVVFLGLSVYGFILWRAHERQGKAV